jgi:glycosyltransferase involved in cell wall biosynthesis
MKAMWRVSAVVSVYSKGRLRYLLDCIDSLRRQSVKPFEVIVVLDPDPDLIDFYRVRLSGDVRVVVGDGFGLSNARNAGVKNSRGDIVAFIDDDAVADGNWLKNILKNYEDPEVVGVGGLIKPLWEGYRPVWLPEELDWVVGCSYKGLPEHRAFVRNPIGCNMSFRREIFDEVGFFRSDIGRFGKLLLGSEETEFSIRILENKPRLKIVYEPSAVVYHRVSPDRVSFSYLLKRSFGEGLSKALIVNSGRNLNYALTTENQYLRYLIGTAVPSRLKSFYKLESVCHLASMLCSSCAVVGGFLVGKLLKSFR